MTHEHGRGREPGGPPVAVPARDLLRRFAEEGATAAGPGAGSRPVVPPIEPPAGRYSPVTAASTFWLLAGSAVLFVVAAVLLAVTVRGLCSV